MKQSDRWSRRAFVGGALVGAGAAAGALVRRAEERGPQRPAAEKLSGDLTYDVSEFETVDPAQLTHRPAGEFATGLSTVRRLASGPNGSVLVAGDRTVAVFSGQGDLQARFEMDRPPHGMAWVEPDELYVAAANYFAVYDAAGRLRRRSPRLSDDSFVTAIGVRGRTVYLADAGRREVVLCDAGTGAVTGRFGRKNEPPGAPGFVVPSPYFDLAVGPERLYVTNPGRLRVETYTFDGQFESSWGEAGMALDRFCGCCNPVWFRRGTDGRFVTSEKGLARIKWYDAAGTFRGVAVGPNGLVEDKERAKRACADCRLGGAFDVLVGERGRLYLLDPYRHSVRVFDPRSAA